MVIGGLDRSTYKGVVGQRLIEMHLRKNGKRETRDGMYGPLFQRVINIGKQRNGVAFGEEISESREVFFLACLPYIYIIYITYICIIYM